MSISLVAALYVATLGQQSTAPTKGTFQLTGDNGKLKTTYQLGEKGNELHFTLDSAQTDTIFPAPEDVYVAGENQRLLILNFTVQNPLNKEMSLGASTFAFTCVSPDDENAKFTGYLLSGVNQKRLSQALKPAQKVKCTIVMPIYAEGEVSKVMVSRGTKTPILRYDLSGKLSPKMKSIFCPNGFDLVNTATAENGQADLGEYAVKFEGLDFSVDKIKGYAPDTGTKYAIITLTFHNRLIKDSFLSFAYINPTLSDDNGIKYVWNKDFLFKGSDDTVYQNLVYGDDALKTRIYYKVKDGATGFKFSLQHVASKRTVRFL